jgi:serine protease AprX
MNQSISQSKQSKSQAVNWGRQAFNLLLTLALVLGLLVPASGPVSAPLAHLHPLLAQLAAESPEQTVAVIVQKAEASDRAEKLAAQLGGTVTTDLHIINAFAAEMTASAARTLAADPSVRWVSLDSPVKQTDTTAQFTTWATVLGTVNGAGFTDATAIVDSALGPNGAFGYGGGGRKSAFAGFAAEVTPGNAIQKVEAVLHAYVPAPLRNNSLVRLKVFVAGVAGNKRTVSASAFSPHVGAANAGTIYVDITGARAWQWADFDSGLELVIEHGPIRGHVYYDAIGLRVTSAPGVDTTDNVAPTSLPKAAIDTSKLLNAYNGAVRATEVWNEAPAYLQGQGVTVALVDSGTVKNRDIGGRVLKNINFNSSYHGSADRYGHGTFVAAIIAGDGQHSHGQYIGIAPKTDLINARVSDDQGMATESDVVSALQWLHENKSRYNIRVVNLSLNSSVAESYHTSPLDAAVEILWFNGIVVVVSAGNNGTATLYPPANDPFVITVGATNDMGTIGLSDDIVAPFSAYGLTESGFAKPDLVAPGANIVALLPENNRLTMSKNRPENRVDDNYFRMSGTSMSAPMVSGAVALLLQDEPNLTPDQVKYRLMATANTNWPGYEARKAGAGTLDIYAAVYGATTENANSDLIASQLLWTGSDPVTWGSVNWNSVNWNSVNWNSVNWNSVNWNSVNWNSDYWGP